MENDDTSETINIDDYSQQMQHENESDISSSTEEASGSSSSSNSFDAIDIAFVAVIGTACIILLAFFMHKFFGRFKAKINVGKTGIEFEDLPDEDKK
jgi:hypothetical protein